MWVLPSTATSKTKVDAIGFTSKEYYPSSVLAILKIVTFLKWMGCLPVLITSVSAGFLRIRFARLHITTVLWILAMALQISLTIDYMTNTTLRSTAGTLVSVLLVSSMTCYTVLIPRLGFASVSALESALNTINQIQGYLCSNFTSSNLWPLAILVPFLESLTLIPNLIRIYLTHEESQALESPIFTLGTGIPLIGNIMHGFLFVFYYISTWIVPIQLFMFCHTLASYYHGFADKIRHDLYPDLPSPYQVNILENSLTHDVGRSQKFRNRLRKLQATSVLIEKAISDFNAYIGMALLLYIVCHLVHIMGNLYYVSILVPQVNFQNTEASISLVNVTQMLVQHIAELLFVIWAADLIPTAANRCKEVVGGIPFCDGDFKEEHGSLDVQLQSFHSRLTAKNVEISACGLFTINRKMIPSVFGTIITYYLIIIAYSPGRSSES